MSEPFFRKPLAGLLLLAGAAGGPYMWFESEAGSQLQQTTRQIWGSGGATANGSSGSGWLTDEGSSSVPGGFLTSAQSSSSLSSSVPNGSSWPLSVSANPSADPLNPVSHVLEQPQIVSLNEVLRFDVTPPWVMARFPRVTTVLADLQLDGLRTPLVTGTGPSDLAGTLTYYFDKYKRLQRVSIHATCGDPTRFVSELQQAYQMTQEPSLGCSLYVLKWNAQPMSILHVQTASVVYADAPYSRYNVFLELNQPGLEYGLSAESRSLIDAGRNTSRW